MSGFENINAAIARALEALGRADGLMRPMVIAVTLAVCLWLWLRRRPGTGFWSWVFPRRIYGAPGFLVDLQVYVLALVLGIVLTVNTAAFATAAAATLGQGLGIGAPAEAARNPLLVALVVFLAGDALGYWFHRLHHEARLLWPIHALHHSAEDLSPLTAFRHHPLWTLAASAIGAAITGVAQAGLLILAVGSLDLWTLFGANAFIAAFNLAAANLRHSHIWLRWPAWLEHVLISPAMHQVHHSIAPQHRDRNYGEVLAVWDWMFDTLYIPRDEETGVEVGLSDAKGRRITQPHGTFFQAMAEPVAQLWRVLRRRT